MEILPYLKVLLYPVFILAVVVGGIWLYKLDTRPISPEETTTFKVDQKRVHSVFDKYSSDVQNIALQISTMKFNWMKRTERMGDEWRDPENGIKIQEHRFIEVKAFPEEGIAVRVVTQGIYVENILLGYQTHRFQFAAEVKNLIEEAFQYLVVLEEIKLTDFDGDRTRNVS